MAEATGDENIISVGDFVTRLFALRPKQAEDESALSLPQLLRYGHFRGWLEDSDGSHPEAPLNRQTAARIIHMFLLIECGLLDLPDITPASKLKDLYTCRVCANHIAQVYCRGIMDAKKEEPAFPDSTQLFFDHLKLMSVKETNAVIANCEAVKQSI